MAAELACIERAGAAFPILAELPDSDEDKISGDFHVDAAGGFVSTVTVKGKGRPLSDEVKCRGNLTDHKIEFVEFNGVKRYPQNQEVWKF